MSKIVVFSCSHCGAQAQKWSGRCVECGKWGTIADEPSAPASPKQTNASAPAKTTSLKDAQEKTSERLHTNIEDIDRVLGGGLVTGEVILLSGEPGIGKSTLLLAVANAIKTKVLYIAGEESPAQIALRAKRLGITGDTLLFVTDTDASTITATIEQERPTLCIIDSIQSLSIEDASSDAGSTTQVRASAAILVESAKKTGVPIIMVGQITKDGSIAGPKTLEHLVDVVLSFEGDPQSGMRILRPEKNRFGNTDEVALFKMTEKGLIPETHPSAVLLADRRPGTAGNAITCFLEGNRPLLVEIQALTTKTGYPTPTRRASGYDTNRLQLIIAILERRVGFSFGTMDVHVNVVGGLRLKDDHSTDLALALALASSITNTPLPTSLVAIGEIGLGGELRRVNHLDRRLTECAAMGFEEALTPASGQPVKGVKVTGCQTLLEALNAAGIAAR